MRAKRAQGAGQRALGFGAAQVGNAIRGMYKQLDKLEIPITETVEFGDAVFFFIRDPDGNVIEFHRPAAAR